MVVDRGDTVLDGVNTRFPSARRGALEGAIRDWTVHMITRSLALSYSCVEIVKISLGYPFLN